MKLYKVKPEYRYGDSSEEMRAKQLEILGTVGAKECDERYVICDAEKAIQLIKAGYAGSYFSLDYITEVFETDTGDSVREMISASVAASVKAAGDLFNSRTQQEQPGPTLFGVTETFLLEDACTDALQDRLSMGWRILAICPQPQRRPDYVLGRTFLPTSAQRP